PRSRGPAGHGAGGERSTRRRPTALEARAAALAWASRAKVGSDRGGADPAALGAPRRRGRMGQPDKGGGIDAAPTRRLGGPSGERGPAALAQAWFLAVAWEVRLTRPPQRRAAGARRRTAPHPRLRPSRLRAGRPPG